MKFFVLTIIFLIITSCASKKIVNGNLPDVDSVSILKIGKDDKSSILKILGEPSFKGSLGDNSYYYIGSLKTKIAFLKSKIKEQYILEFKFNKKNILKDIYFYDKSRTTDVAMSSLKTESGGLKQGLLSQILGNFGVPGMGRGGPILGSGKADD